MPSYSNNPPYQNWDSGRYYWAPPVSTGGVILLTNGQIVASQFWAPGGAITNIGCDVTVVGEAGSKVRLGIYGDDGADLPGQLVVDGGQIAGDSNTVQLTPTLSVSGASPLVLVPGYYWMVVAGQGGSTTPPTIRTNVGGALPNMPFTPTSIAAPFQSVVCGTAITAVASTFPQSFGSPSSRNQYSPRTFVKVQ